jgi:transcription elongation factor Elf1
MVPSEKNAEVTAKYAVTLSLILHTVTVFALTCIMIYAYIRFERVWVIGVGVMLSTVLTFYTHKHFMRCLYAFCNNHIHLVACMAEHMSNAFTVMKKQEKAISEHARAVIQSYEVLASIADKLDAVQNPEREDKQDTAEESQAEDSENQ